MDVALSKIDGLYKVDPEAAHAMEDDILWAYIAKRALDGEEEANGLIDWAADHTDRTRWYS